jgi:hypothetical protein
MKKIISILLLGILVLSGLEALAGTENEDSEYKTHAVSFSQPIIKTENEYVSINMDETNTFLRGQGKPRLPCYIYTFSFPFGTEINKVTCELSNFQEKKLTKHIKPTPKIAAIGSTIVNNKVEPINYGTNPYPSEWFDYDVGCGRNGKDINVFVKAEVFPVKYYPMDKRIEWAGNAKVFVEYNLPSKSATFNDEYKFIVLAPDEFSDELSPLITHKINRGISTKFVSLNDIYNSVYFPVNGRDNPEKVKYFIKNAIENWNISYVLLVGGSAKFPIRKTHVYINHPDDPDDEIFVSDLYYADIYDENSDFCSWDSNFNDVFGEFNWSDSHNYDEVDLYPDVYFGRLACVNSNEVTTCVNKIKKYEDDAAYSQDWFNDIVVIGGDTWVPDSGDDSGIPEGELINQNILDAMNGFNPDKIWDSNGRLGTWAIPYGSGDISNTIGKGCGFLEWSGHGNTNVWATHRHNSSDDIWIPTPLGFYINNYVKNLGNGDKLPIVVVGGCSCGKFNLDWDCFAWSFVLNSGGGGIAVIAASGLLYSAFGEETIDYVAGLIEINTFKAYKEMNAITFGEMWAWGIKKYIDMSGLELEDEYCYDYKTMEQWQAFGDPTLAIAPESQPPEKPDPPVGPIEGEPEIEYTFNAETTDPDNNDIYYKFSWGDGKITDWIGPVESGTIVSENHTWSSTGTFKVRVRAKDIHEDQSEWSDPLIITIDKSKKRVINFNPLLLQIFNRFPNLFPILRFLLEL